MIKLTALTNYRDDLGNVVDSPTTFDRNVTITVRGRNNKIIVDGAARIQALALVFDCDNGTLTIGPNSRHGINMFIRIGQDSTVNIGTDVTTTGRCIISAVEGSAVSIGNDVMIASDNQFLSDDSHPIFDIYTEKRTNPAKDITIGDHVWFGEQAVALGGTVVGDGTVIGFRSIVKGKIPNNCVAVGAPAKVIRRNIAWERPHLSFTAPAYKPDAKSIQKSKYWTPTDEFPIKPQRKAIQKLGRTVRRIRQIAIVTRRRNTNNPPTEPKR